MFLHTTDTAKAAILSVLACAGTAKNVKRNVRSHFQSDVEVDGFVLYCFAHGCAEIDVVSLIAWMLLPQDEKDIWTDAALRQGMIEERTEELVEADPGMDYLEALREATERYENLGEEEMRMVREEMREKRPFIIQLGHPPEDESHQA